MSARRWTACALLAAAVLGQGGAALAEEPTLAALQAEVRQSGKPLLLDVYTVWCKPCQEMDQRVFPDAAVKKALEAYRLQRLDAEGAQAKEIVERLGVTAYPTLLLFSPDGVEVTRLFQQTEPASLAHALTILAPLASTRGPLTDAERERRPEDGGLAFLMALEEDRSGHPARAVSLRQRAAALWQDTFPELAARAAWMNTVLAGRGATPDARAEALVDFAVRYSKDETAVRAAEGLAYFRTLGPIPRASSLVFERVSQAQAKGRRAEGLRRLVYAQLGAQDAAGALVSARRLRALGKTDVALAAQAEATFQTGQRAAAMQLEKQRRPSKVSAVAHEATLVRFEKGPLGLPPALGHFSDPFAPSAEEQQREYARKPQVQEAVALQAAAARLREPCLPHAAGGKDVLVTVELQGGKILHAWVVQAFVLPELRKCLESHALTLEGLPRETSGQRQLRVRF